MVRRAVFRVFEPVMRALSGVADPAYWWHALELFGIVGLVRWVRRLVRRSPGGAGGP